jgi:hypothetical protein
MRRACEFIPQNYFIPGIKFLTSLPRSIVLDYAIEALDTSIEGLTFAEVKNTTMKIVFTLRCLVSNK